MSRSRRSDDLVADAYKLSDNEGAEDRHEPADVLRYINQGGAELHDLLRKALGDLYFRKVPAYQVDTDSDTTRYALPDDFLTLLSVRVQGNRGAQLERFTLEEEPVLRELSGRPFPTHYQLQPEAIELLPSHRAGVVVIVDYIRGYKDLVLEADAQPGDATKLEGYSGWEDYPVTYAARVMARRDDKPAMARDLGDDLGRLAARIAALAPKRDGFRPQRVRDVRMDRRVRRCP